MAYEEISSIEAVTLGGVNKKTNKPNPTELEGYLVGKEERPNKFNPGKPQNFYIFQTKHGLQGVYAKAGIDSALKNARLGHMTKLVATGEELDTGKGFPMKVFKSFQDKTNTIDTSTIDLSSGQSDDDGTPDYADVEEKTPDPTTVKRVSSTRQAEIQALLRSRK